MENCLILSKIFQLMFFHCFSLGRQTECSPTCLNRSGRRFPFRGSICQPYFSSWHRVTMKKQFSEHADFTTSRLLQFEHRGSCLGFRGKLLEDCWRNFGGFAGGCLAILFGDLGYLGSQGRCAFLSHFLPRHFQNSEKSRNSAHVQNF